MSSDAGGAVARRRRDVLPTLRFLCNICYVFSRSLSLRVVFDFYLLLSPFNGVSEICDRKRRWLQASLPLPYPLLTSLISKSTKEESSESSCVSSLKYDICLIIYLRSTRSRTLSGFSEEHSLRTLSTTLTLPPRLLMLSCRGIITYYSDTLSKEVSLLWCPCFSLLPMKILSAGLTLRLRHEPSESFLRSESHGASFAPVKTVTTSGATLTSLVVSFYRLDPPFRQLDLDLTLTMSKPIGKFGPTLSPHWSRPVDFIILAKRICWIRPRFFINWIGLAPHLPFIPRSVYSKFLSRLIFVMFLYSVLAGRRLHPSRVAISLGWLDSYLCRVMMERLSRVSSVDVNLKQLYNNCKPSPK